MTNRLIYPGEEPLRCSGEYDGEAVGGGAIASGASTLTIVPTYFSGPCVTENETHKATITMNGCDYVYHLGATVHEDAYLVGADLTCPAGQAMEVDIYFSSGNENVKICTVKVEGQSDLTGGLIETVTGAGIIELIGELGHISAKKSGACGSGSTTGASLELDIEFFGKNEIGGSTNATLSG